MNHKTFDFKFTIGADIFLSSKEFASEILLCRFYIQNKKNAEKHLGCLIYALGAHIILFLILKFLNMIFCKKFQIMINFVINILRSYKFKGYYQAT